MTAALLWFLDCYYRDPSFGRKVGTIIRYVYFLLMSSGFFANNCWEFWCDGYGKSLQTDESAGRGGDTTLFIQGRRGINITNLCPVWTRLGKAHCLYNSMWQKIRLKPFEVGVHCIYIGAIDCHIWNLSLHGQWSWNNSFILGRGVGANTEMYNWNVHGR